jgi:hypothetical protein
MEDKPAAQVLRVLIRACAWPRERGASKTDAADRFGVPTRDAAP